MRHRAAEPVTGVLGNLDPTAIQVPRVFRRIIEGFQRPRALTFTAREMRLPSAKHLPMTSRQRTPRIGTAARRAR